MHAHLRHITLEKRHMNAVGSRRAETVNPQIPLQDVKPVATLVREKPCQ